MDRNKQKLLFDGLDGDFISSEDLMTTVKVYFDSGKNKIPMLIEFCEENNFKWDVELWRKVK